MNLTRILQRLCQCLWVAVSIVVLVGCKSATQPEAKYGMVQTQAVAHTPYNVTQFYINNHWGGSAGAYGTGGGGVCCVPIPYHWKEGLTAKVRWTYSEAINDAHGKPIGETVWYEYDAPVLPFQSLQDIVVHFFPDGTAKIVVLSPENVSQPPIADPVRPKGWENNPVEYYCKVVKLNGMSEKKCRELTFESYYGSSR